MPPIHRSTHGRVVLAIMAFAVWTLLLLLPSHVHEQYEVVGAPEVPAEVKVDTAPLIAGDEKGLPQQTTHAATTTIHTTAAATMTTLVTPPTVESPIEEIIHVTVVETATAVIVEYPTTVNAVPSLIQETHVLQDHATQPATQETEASESELAQELRSATGISTSASQSDSTEPLAKPTNTNSIGEQINVSQDLTAILLPQKTAEPAATVLDDTTSFPEVSGTNSKTNSTESPMKPTLAKIKEASVAAN